MSVRAFVRGNSNPHTVITPRAPMLAVNVGGGGGVCRDEWVMMVMSGS